MAANKPEDSSPSGMALASDMANQGLQKISEISPKVKEVFNQAKPYLEKLEPLIRAAYPYCAIVKDHTVKGYYVLQPYYDEEVGAILLGFTLLFYGGHFAMTIACWQVYNATGQKMMKKSWSELRISFQEAYHTLQKDAEARALFDSDRDGSIAPSELLVGLKEIAVATTEAEKSRARKKVLLIMKCIDPSKISDAAIGLFTGLLAILAALRSRFVQCITVGANVGKKVAEIISPMVQPKLYEAFPNHTKWVDWLLRASGGILGAIASLILIRVISAFNSALEGSAMLVQYLQRIAERKGWMGSFKPTLEQSRFAIGALTFVGFAAQLKSGFSLPFYFRIPLMPVLTLEYILTLLAARPF